MKYFSTNNPNQKVNFRTAVLKGLAEDGGLFMPEFIPGLENNFISNLNRLSIQEIAYNVLSKFIQDEIEEEPLKKIITESINFPAPLVILDETYNVLELFHGPTLAFKDFGARFMARTMEYFAAGDSREIKILVATSGDTGSAVANGFLNADGINVFVLYPSGKISEIQEKQITTLGSNITAVEIEGTFDDCQKIVKQAFVDPDLKIKNLSSANSINLGRLLPQSIYYFEAYKQLHASDSKIVFSVPSGNLGNLTAGLIAKLMGLKIDKFVAATNANDVFTAFLDSGEFIPRSSVRTYSNAMDVGDPSNLARILHLFNHNLSVVNDIIFSKSFSDDQTLQAIEEVFNKLNYIIDPHGAVGYLALKNYLNETENAKGIILETAHPAKFKDVVEKIKLINVDIPERLIRCLDKEKSSVRLSNDYEIFKEFLLT